MPVRSSVVLPFRLLAVVLTTTSAVYAAKETSVSTSSTDAQKAQLAEAYGNLPLSFEANAGQTDKQVKFLSRGSRHSLFLTPMEAVLVLSRNGHEAKNPSREKTKPSQEIERSVLRMQLQGANSKPSVKGEEELVEKSSYFIGKDPTNWQTNVTHYAKVRYEEVYPGIDLVYYGNQRQLEYDFVLAPGADPNAITLRINGVDQIRIDDNGDLVLTTKLGEVKQNKPVIYQEMAGKRREVKGSYTLKSNNEIGLKLASYDRSRSVVIDPVLALGYSTYLGGSSADWGHDIVVDGNGNAYITGYAASMNFPAANAVQPAKAGGTYGVDAFIAKLNATGNTLLYSTYLGGTAYDEGHGIAVDASGNAYVTGMTYSTDFPLANALQSARAGYSDDAFVAKLNAAGNTLVYSTHLGGSALDHGIAIAVDTSGNAYVTGGTHSPDFPIANALQSANAGGGDVFITKLNAAGNNLVYSTYLGGGNAADFGYDIALDSSGNVYVTGLAWSTTFPIVNALQSQSAGGFDAFITKLNAAGNTLVYSTYLGGSALDHGIAIAVDTSGNAYVTGSTGSTNFPIANALQSANAGNGDAFITKLNAAGNTLVYSTYLGGGDAERGSAIAVDAGGNAHVTGFTSSPNFPLANALQSANAGDLDAFITKLIATLTPEQLLRRLIEKAEALVEANKIQTGLTAPLEATEKSLAKGRGAAVNQIEAFIRQVEASVRSGRLLKAKGAELIEDANQIIQAIQAS